MSNRFVSNLTGSSMLEIFLVVSTLSVRNPTLSFFDFFLIFFCFCSTTRFSEFMNFIAQFYLFHQSNRFSYLISGFVSYTSCNWLQKWIWWSILFCCRICKINSLFFVFLLEAYGTSFKFLMLLINFMLRIVDYTVLSHIMYIGEALFQIIAYLGIRILYFPYLSCGLVIPIFVLLMKMFVWGISNSCCILISTFEPRFKC